MPSICQVYMVELLSHECRSVLGTTFVVAISVGITLVYALGAIMSWDLVCWSFVGITAAMMISVMFIPESPNWLVQNRRIGEAEKALQKIRGNSYDISTEISDLKAVFSMDQQHQSFWLTLGEFTHPETYKPALLLALLWLLQQFCGNYAVIFYAVDILSGIGMKDAVMDVMKMTENEAEPVAHPHIDPSFLAAIIVGLMRITASVIGAILIKKARKRTLMIASNTLMTITMGLLAVAVYFKYEYMDIEWLKWLPILLTSSFIFAFGIGMNNIPWLLVGELCPSKVRAISSAMAVTLCAISVFIVVKLFPVAVETFSPHVTYGFFAVCSAIGIVVSAVLIPDTEGKTLRELDALYVKKSNSTTNSV